MSTEANSVNREGPRQPAPFPHDQLRIQIGTNRMQTVYDAVSKLNKASLLNKNGDKFSLKEL